MKQQDEFEEFEEDEEDLGEDAEQDEEEMMKPAPKMRKELPKSKEKRNDMGPEEYNEKVNPQMFKKPEPKAEPQYVIVPRAVSVEQMFNEIYDKLERIEAILSRNEKGL